jgi:hypothetical protein
MIKFTFLRMQTEMINRNGDFRDCNLTATIRKYNHEIKRTIDNRIWIDNVLQRRGGK